VFKERVKWRLWASIVTERHGSEGILSSIAMLCWHIMRNQANGRFRRDVPNMICITKSLSMVSHDAMEERERERKRRSRTMTCVPLDAQAKNAQEFVRMVPT